MDTREFLKNFRHIFSEPNSVQRLRELILQLAFQGRLVSQDSQEGTAANISQQIQKVKDTLIKEKKIKKDRKYIEISEDEIPFSIPHTWKWERIGSVTNYGMAEKIESSELSDDVWVLELGDVEKITSRLIKRVTHKERKSKSTKNKFIEGDVLYGKLRPYLDKVLVADRDGVCTTEMIPFRGYYGIDSMYLRWVLKSPFFISYANNSTHGMNLPRLGTEKAKQALIPIAPLGEQKRIVAKIESLIKLCDQLEAQQVQLAETSQKTNQATLNELVFSIGYKQFAKNWNRISENFQVVASGRNEVEKLKNSILGLSVQGKLVEKYSGDESVEIILNRIKNSLIQETKIGRKRRGSLKARSIKPLPDSTLIPDNWKWVYLDDILLFMDAGWSPTCEKHPAAKNKWGVLKTTAVQPLKFIETENKELPAKLSPRSEYEVQTGDILVTRAGPKQRVGIACVVKKVRRKLMISDKTIRFRLADSRINPDFVAMCLSSWISAKHIEESKSGMAESQMNIPQEKLRATPILLVPPEQQKKIVDQYRSLEKKCDQLIGLETEFSSVCEKLAAATVHSITTKQQDLKITVHDSIAIKDKAEAKVIRKFPRVLIKLVKTMKKKIEDTVLAKLLMENGKSLEAKVLWQKSGISIDEFYATLKSEIKEGFIAEPDVATLKLAEVAD